MEKAKEIISKFLKISPDEIDENTIIDKTKIPGSLYLHRMYSKLAENGYIVDDFTKIKTFGDFLKALKKENIEKNEIILKEENDFIDIGIDVEEISNLPKTEDFRRDSFYTNNFSQREISYCILQENPYASFAGKFAAKEALIKVDSNLKGIPFNQIEILNNEQCKPIYKKNYHISISHTGNFAVAVVLKFKNINNINKSKVVANFPSSELIPKKDNTKYLNIFLTLLIILNIILLVLILK